MNVTSQTICSYLDTRDRIESHSPLEWIRSEMCHSSWRRKFKLSFNGALGERSVSEAIWNKSKFHERKVWGMTKCSEGFYVCNEWFNNSIKQVVSINMRIMQHNAGRYRSSVRLGRGDDRERTWMYEHVILSICHSSKTWALNWTF